MQTGYIYKLVCSDINVTEIYVGSTKNQTRRKCQHKSKCNNESNNGYNLNVYQYIRANGGFANWELVQLEQVTYNTRPELRARERHYIESLGASLNSIIPNRTRQEYRDDNKESIDQYHKQYRDDNKESIDQYQKQYRDDNKEKTKQYYKDKKEQRMLKDKALMTCTICNTSFQYGNRFHHIKTKYHLENYKEAYLECWGEKFEGKLTYQDY